MRIGIVNDMLLAREVLRRVVLSVPGYSVAWLANDGAEAVHLATRDRPDVVLMDLVMPKMNGVEATRRIMATSPCPILVVTASVTGNFPLVCEAMSHGGLDAVSTPVLGLDGRIMGGEVLLARLARVDHGRQPSPAGAMSAPLVSAPRHDPLLPPLLALGASTGGPEALAQILHALPAECPAAVVVIEHIAAEFTANLVAWLQRRCVLPVAKAVEGSRPLVGTVSVAATDDHLLLRSDLCFACTREPADYPFRPSINVFFESAAANWARPGVGVLLTGMGSDGARGLAALRQAGWLTIAQDEASSVAFGMPRAAAELHAANRILPLSEIPAAIVVRLQAVFP